MNSLGHAFLVAGILDILSIILVSAGLFMMLAGVIGILRLPDFYTRLHAQGKCDTLGVALMLGGLALYEGATLNSLKILAVVVFIAIANPTATHALGRAARKAGLKSWTKPGKKG